jgi:hypothetical protein
MICSGRTCPPSICVVRMAFRLHPLPYEPIPVPYRRQLTFPPVMENMMENNTVILTRVIFCTISFPSSDMKIKQYCSPETNDFPAYYFLTPSCGSE